MTPLCESDSGRYSLCSLKEPDTREGVLLCYCSTGVLLRVSTGTQGKGGTTEGFSTGVLNVYPQIHKVQRVQVKGYTARQGKAGTNKGCSRGCCWSTSRHAW